MKRDAQIKLLLTFIFFTFGAIFFALGIQKYQVITVPRADVGIVPPEGAGAGFTDFPNVRDDSYTPPLALENISATMKQTATNGYCNVETKLCKGWAWKYVCSVAPSVNWATIDNPNWTDEQKHQLYNRHCTKQTGSTQDIGVKFDANGMSAPANQNQIYKLNDVGCGKLVQVDITTNNCEPNAGIGGKCDDIIDYLVYYTGVCAETTPIPPELPTIPPTVPPTEPTTPPTEIPTIPPTVPPTELPTEPPTNTPTTPPDQPTNTPAPTSTPVPTATNTPVPTQTPTPIPTETPVPTPTDTPIPTATETPIPTVTLVLTATDTPIPTTVGTSSPTITTIIAATNTPTTVQQLTVEGKPPGITPWLLVLAPLALILLGLLL